MKKYTTKEIAELFGVSERTIQRHITTLSDNISNTDRKGFSIPEDIVFFLAERHHYDILATTNDNERQDKNEEFPHIEYFTEEEYQEFKKRITEYPFLKEQIKLSNEHLDTLKTQIEYFRLSYNKQLDIHEKLIGAFRERNFIEAKEKGMDK
ncbi:HTH domain-containing protein [Riemerella anatipestifer]|uniref:Putative replication protein n=1 Tax=Riemerella anatipestifer TaxID=34085 RepID=E5D2K8_RIEAN|nr:HTH domain-containing protein [Riemerella anatipestifer]ADD83118.1 putative replication protein [Riemerella anatipestifer]AEM66520.1 replication protein 2 [Riemerella anatipestifer]AEM66530.1 replication protein 2 [Riemerella anatipestifer]MBT0554880.1 HTH domain-containing protein [Riemerella anatipestifer]MBT0563178.1 HTH domain-containing protein [Riemerella anatipestifer]